MKPIEYFTKTVVERFPIRTVVEITGIKKTSKRLFSKLNITEFLSFSTHQLLTRESLSLSDYLANLVFAIEPFHEISDEDDYNEIVSYICSSDVGALVISKDKPRIPGIFKLHQSGIYMRTGRS